MCYGGGCKCAEAQFFITFCYNASVEKSPDSILSGDLPRISIVTLQFSSQVLRISQHFARAPLFQLYVRSQYSVAAELNGDEMRMVSQKQSVDYPPLRSKSAECMLCAELCLSCSVGEMGKPREEAHDGQ